MFNIEDKFRDVSRKFAQGPVGRTLLKSPYMQAAQQRSMRPIIDDFNKPREGSQEDQMVNMAMGMTGPSGAVGRPLMQGGAKLAGNLWAKNVEKVGLSKADEFLHEMVQPQTFRVLKNQAGKSMTAVTDLVKSTEDVAAEALGAFSLKMPNLRPSQYREYLNKALHSKAVDATRRSVTRAEQKGLANYQQEGKEMMKPLGLSEQGTLPAYRGSQMMKKFPGEEHGEDIFTRFADQQELGALKQPRVWDDLKMNGQVAPIAQKGGGRPELTEMLTPEQQWEAMQNAIPKLRGTKAQNAKNLFQQFK